MRRFDIERTFRFLKQTLGWTVPQARDPEAADRWTWLVIAAFTQLAAARSLADDLRLRWEAPAEPGLRRPARLFPSLAWQREARGREACAILPAGTGISEAEYRRNTGGIPAGIRRISTARSRRKAVLTTGNAGMGDPRLAGFARQFVGFAALRWHHV